MALSLTILGGTLQRALKPILANPAYVVPSSLSQQVRHAKRKGYRQIALSKKKKEKAEKVVKEKVWTRRVFSTVEKTFDLDKPNPPSDDVFIADLFNYPKYSIVEAVNFHKEYHHPTVHNNPDASIHVLIEFDMTGKKQTQVIKPFKGVSPIPNEFVHGLKKEILVLCKPEDQPGAIESGAAVAGGVELVKKIQSGAVQISLYDYILCHLDFAQELAPIRGLLKNQLPRLKAGTLTADLNTAIKRFLYGVPYNCIVGSSKNFGYMQCVIGNVEMESEKVEENLKSLLEHLKQYRPPREGDFVTWIWCMSPPSDEKFSIDLSLYIEKPKKEEIDDDDDDDDDNREVPERLAIKLAQEKLIEETTFEKS